MMVVTGEAQREAWQRRALPPIEQPRAGLWSIPVPIPDNPMRYTLSYAFVEDDGIVLLEDGDLLPMTGRAVRAVWTPGHTPGHLCLHDAEAGILLTGDHLLPRITPNVAVLPTSTGDPLGAYLTSLDRTAAFDADEALPAHEWRFRGLKARAGEVLDHHAKRDAEILRAVDRLDEPTAWHIAASLTWSRGWDSLHGLLRRMALAETLAHLWHLAEMDMVAPTHGDPALWLRSGDVHR